MANKFITKYGKSITIEENTCKHRFDRHCVLLGVVCPSMVKYDEDNENNVPCDLASYKPQKEGE